MAKVKYITSANEIPAGQKCLLVMYGQEYAQTRHDFGLTITVARQQSKTVSELSFLTAVHTAKGIAKQEGISEIFVCAATPCPTPDYSSSAGWPHFAGISRRTPPATAAEVPRSPCDATMRRPQLVWPGSPQANRVVGMKTKR
jgi:hypothetical protein